MGNNQSKGLLMKERDNPADIHERLREAASHTEDRRCLERILNAPTREYIKEDICLLTDFSKQNCLSAENVIAMLNDRRYNEKKKAVI